MRIAVMGTGGMGGYYGGFLAARGHDVTFIARGTHLDVIREHGLKVIGPRENLHITPAQATDDPATLEPVDVVLFAVKLYDAEAAAGKIKPLLRDGTMVVSLMNGVDGPERIEAVIGPGHTVGGSAYASAKIDEPGVVSYRSEMAKLIIGELDGTHSERCQAFAAACTGTDFDVEISTDIHQTLWQKFVLLATNAALTTVTRQPAAVVYGDVELKRLAMALMREVIAVAQAKGVTLPSDTLDQAVMVTESFSPDLYASMYYDLVAGKPLELDAFSGLITRLGADLGVSTPHHATLYACLRPYEHGRPPIPDPTMT